MVRVSTFRFEKVCHLCGDMKYIGSSDIGCIDTKGIFLLYLVRYGYIQQRHRGVSNRNAAVSGKTWPGAGHNTTEEQQNFCIAKDLLASVFRANSWTSLHSNILKPGPSTKLKVNKFPACLPKVKKRESTFYTQISKIGNKAPCL